MYINSWYRGKVIKIMSEFINKKTGFNSFLLQAEPEPNPLKYTHINFSDSLSGFHKLPPLDNSKGRGVAPTNKTEDVL